MANQRLTLNTLEATRRSLTKIMRFYHSGALDAEKFRNLVYGFSCLLQYWKTANEQEIEARIAALEAFIKESGGPR